MKDKQTKRYYLLLTVGITLVFYGLGWMMGMAWAGFSIGLGIGLLMVAHRMNPRSSE